ncbi:hypothetical protein CPT_Mokit_044 [Acinetobacter phage Mokit]|nr:hypothetical protein CPT_Mokit_044 [Acinetobacter phage Mokit]
MKFYKVNRREIYGKRIGNSLADVHRSSPIFKAEYVKTDDELNVFSIHGQPIWRDRFSYHQMLQLQLCHKDLELFVECEDPGKKQVSNIKYQVVTRDYDGCSVVETHDSVKAATERCGYLNEVSPEYHEVHVEFDYEWEN